MKEGERRKQGEGTGEKGERGKAVLGGREGQGVRK